MWNKILFYTYYFTFKIISSIFKAENKPLPDIFKNILIFSTAGIGDMLSDSPAIKAVKTSFPGSNVDLVTHKRRADIHYHNTFVDNFYIYEKGIISFFRLLSKVKRKKYDAVIILRANDPDIWPLAYLVNKNAVISNSKRTRMPFLVAHPVHIPEWERMHGVEQTLKIVSYIGANVDDKSMVYSPTEEELSKAEEILSGEGLLGTDIIAFQVGGGRKKSYRDWSAEKYIALGKMFLDEFHGNIILLGGTDNLKKGKEIQNKLPSHNFVGKLTIPMTAAVLKKCKVLVSTDTGIMHLGFAIGVHTLALLHYRHPSSRVGPYGYGQKHFVVQLETPDTENTNTLDALSPGRAYESLRILCERNGIKKKSESKGQR